MMGAWDKHGGVVPTGCQHYFMINIFDTNTLECCRDNPPVVVQIPHNNYSCFKYQQIANIIL